MRGRVAGGIASVVVLCGCSLGVVDLPADPSPAELFVASQLETDPVDPSQVRLVVRATLDPGIGLDGVPRGVVSDLLGVGDGDYSPSDGGDPSRPIWLATESYAPPGPEGVALRLPRLQGFGPAERIRMRIRVDVTSGGTIVLGDGDDLVLTSEPPSNPAQTLEWSLQLTSTSMPTFGLTMGGSESWPEEVRVPASQLPASALPVEATLRIRWDRSLNLVELTPDERYDLALRSTMVVGWTVEVAG